MTEEVAQEESESKSNGYHPANISQMSDATLDEAIAKLRGGELDESADDGDESNEREASDNDEAEGDEKEGQENEQEGKEKAEESEQPLPKSRAELDKLVASAVERETAKLQKRVNDSQSWIQARDREIGNLRKELTQSREALEKMLNDGDFTNPADQARAQNKLGEIEKDLSTLDAHEEEENYAKGNYEYVSQYVDLNKVETQEVVKTLRSVGADDTYISKFLENPFKQATGDGLVWFFRHVQVEKALRELIPLTEQLYGMLKKSEGDSDEKGKRILERIQTASKHAERLPGGSGNSKSAGKNVGFSPREVANLSDADLDAAIEKEQRRQRA